MPLKTTNPITPSLRGTIRLKKSQLNPIFYIKKNILKQNKSGGRNNSGKITVAHRGGGHKQRYRNIQFNRKMESVGINTSIEYDPNRNCYIASIYDFLKKSYFYIIAPKNLKVGSIVKSGHNAEAKIGHALTISKIPVGSFIHCISVKSAQKSKVSRSAGTFAILIEKTLKHARIQISSGEQRYLSVNCVATIGSVSNEFFFLTTTGKAGRSRWNNNRPHVRGVAKNPIDHPHGGGEGKKSKKSPPVTPWGKSVKYKKTSRSKNKLIIKNSNNGSR